MEKNFFEYIIIGAGISGLTIANYIKNNYIILEKENEVGGYCRTIKKGDFIWDYAGHFFHFKTDEFKKIFMDDVCVNGRQNRLLVPSRFFLFAQFDPVFYPRGKIAAALRSFSGYTGPSGPAGKASCCDL